LLELLFEFLLQVVLEACGEFLLTLGVESIGHALKGTREASPTLAIVGAAIIGAVCGGTSYAVFRQPILRPGQFPGLSLVVAPLVSGALMRVVGDNRRAAGKDTTILATFWGAAIFGFTMAAARFLLIRVW